ncbi:hypothetical protein MACK_000716 [Theileria orientalis]|uniref:G-patch domain-containing protein n=1 Tax=Theileria orientalis TaxID=68886 RepID=A0A976MA43_THEOR|nr:hypothetical protein MACK_000716 [Theileria orientalis]
MASYNSRVDESVGENPSPSTSSWISHRAYLTPATLKRGKNVDSISNSKHIPINLNKSLDRSYKSVANHSSQSFNYNFNDEYDPRFPNEYEKVSKIFSIKSHIKSSTSVAPVAEKPVSREPTPSVEPEQRLSGDEMLKRRLEAMAKSELYSEGVDGTQPQDDGSEGVTTKLEAPEPKRSQPVALKMMEKMGWKEGLGLGKNEQGMVTPLVAKQTGKNSAIIVNALPRVKGLYAPKTVSEPAEAQPQPEGVKSRISIMIFPSKADLDMDELEEITSEYGSLVNIKVLSEDEYKVLESQPECSELVDKYPMTSNKFVICEYETEEQSERLILALNSKRVMESRVDIHYFPMEVYKNKLS